MIIDFLFHIIIEKVQHPARQVLISPTLYRYSTIQLNQIHCRTQSRSEIASERPSAYVGEPGPNRRSWPRRPVCESSAVNQAGPNGSTSYGQAPRGVPEPAQREQFQCNHSYTVTEELRPYLQPSLVVLLSLMVHNYFYSQLLCLTHSHKQHSLTPSLTKHFSHFNLLYFGNNWPPFG